MKNEVHQHPDGHVVVRTAKGEVYLDSSENFARDFGEALPDLPEGATERLYRQGVFHAINDGENTIAGGPMPWPLGDRIIAAIANLREKHAARQPKLPTIEEKNAELMIRAAAEAKEKLEREMKEMAAKHPPPMLEPPPLAKK